MDYRQLLIDNGQKKERRYVEELRTHKDRDDLETSLFSLLLLNRRPKLGLLRPNTAPQLREKGIWAFSTLQSPMAT
jgi:hypothetical protein